MNKLGIHSLLFTSDWNPESGREVFRQAAELGYDLVEVLMFDPADADAAATRALSEEFGVGVATGICGTLTADLSNPDPEIARRGEELIVQAIGVTRDMGASMMGGPTFSAVHRYLSAPSPQAWERMPEIYGRLAAAGERAGVRVGLEALNRYESNFVNTVGQAAEIVRAVSPEWLFVHGDLFHMNIEERDLATALTEVADVLGYVHVAESNRGRLGDGNIDWDSVFGALARIDYQGPITFESFSGSVTGPDFATLVGLWREPWSDPVEVAADGLAHLRRHLSKAKGN
ncbi:sugar phosphate isomerase/epimerase [Nakamurella silvestris]|nr:sugar phosphate isomerase/epimerase [Nakamurella silvestris]